MNTLKYNFEWNWKQVKIIVIWDLETRVFPLSIWPSIRSVPLRVSLRIALVRQL